jgi:hypothetical protein
VSENPKERLAEALNLALADDQSQALREQIAQEVPVTLAANGHRLLIHHELDSNTAGVGFATATLMAAELGEGAQRLYGAGLWYPGAALIRQLIECGYLLTLMSESRDEAASWRSSHKEVINRFMVRHMRERAVHSFGPTEYESTAILEGIQTRLAASCSAPTLITSSCRPALIGSIWHSTWPTHGRRSSRRCRFTTHGCNWATHCTVLPAPRQEGIQVQAGSESTPETTSTGSI